MSLDALPRGTESEQPDVLYLRGKAMQALKRPKAGEILAQACRAKPQEDYCEDAAILMLREERLPEAAELLENELRSQEPTATVLSTLGLIQFRLGRYQEATTSYTRAIKCDPSLAAPREGLAFLLYMTGDLEARSTYHRGRVKGISAQFLYSLSSRVDPVADFPSISSRRSEVDSGQPSTEPELSVGVLLARKDTIGRK